MGADGDRAYLPLEDSGKATPSAPRDRAPTATIRAKRLPLLLLPLTFGAAVILYFNPAILDLVWDRLDYEAGEMAPVRTGEVAFPEDRPAEVVALGHLKPDGGALALALPYGADDARIARLLVSEGDRFEAGQVIAELDNMPALLAAKASAESNLAAQQAALEQVRASVLASLADARASRAVAEATRILAKQELERQTKLAARNSTTQALLQQAHANAVKAQAELGRTTALVIRFTGAGDGSQSDIVLAARNLDVARANLSRANDDLAAGQVIAPQAGTVLKIHARLGERPGEAGLATIGLVEQMTAELEVYQTDIQKIALGQQARMTSPALTAPLIGQVTAIGQIVERQSVMDSEPAANADARVVRVTVTLDAASSALARSYTNIEIVGRIRMKPK